MMPSHRGAQIKLARPWESTNTDRQVMSSLPTRSKPLSHDCPAVAPYVVKSAVVSRTAPCVGVGGSLQSRKISKV